jgi:hypothetical protein
MQSHRGLPFLPLRPPPATRPGAELTPVSQSTGDLALRILDWVLIAMLLAPFVLA